MSTKDINTIKKKKKTPTEERVNCYKYYFQDVSEKHLRKLIDGNLHHFEMTVFNKRNGISLKLKPDTTIFADFITGVSYKSLVIKYKISHRRVMQAIDNVRTCLLNDIREDIESGKLVYTPITEKQTYKRAYLILFSKELLVKTLKKHNLKFD
jgi:hypothetical protein